MRYQNPILPGFYPDPSIERAGRAYYLVTSSFEYFPGIPLFHSTDLVNWTQIGNCINWRNPVPLEAVSDSGGIWAPTIRYHAGVFYVTATLEGYGNFIVRSENLAEGFSQPVWVPMGGIDPSLFFEDGRAYYCTNESPRPGCEAISLAQIDPDTGALLSDITPAFYGTGGGYLEAPHIYHIGDWYYLLTAEGGTNFCHMATISRSRTLFGPYEACPDNPVLSNRHDTTRQAQCTGHADLFEDHNGNWWMVHLGMRLSRRTMTNLGRETFLTPVVWRDGWPFAAGDGKARIDIDAPLWAEQRPRPGFETRFEGEDWEPQWLFLRTPDSSAYRRGQGLMLFPRPTTFEEKKSPSFVAVRQRDFACVLETAMDFSPEAVDDEAGVVIYLASDFHYRLCKRHTPEGDRLTVYKIAEDMRQIAYDAPVLPGKLRMRIAADKEYYYFHCAVNDGEFHPLCKASTRFLSCEVAGRCFTGTVMGVYAMGTGSHPAVFKYFRMDDV